MHSLEVLEVLNARAAGRELGHAVADDRPVFAASPDGRGWTAPAEPAALRAFCAAADVAEQE